MYPIECYTGVILLLRDLFSVTFSVNVVKVSKWTNGHNADGFLNILWKNIKFIY